MKKLLLFIGAIILGGSAFAQLSGSYLIGATGTYTTIQDACTDLETEGQDGPVIFNIEGAMDPYIESITLNAVSGNSATNTITFQSEMLDSSTVQIESITGNTFSFNDVSYVSFNQVALAYTNSTGYGSVVYVQNGSDYSFDHVQIMQVAPEDAVSVRRDAGLYNIHFTDCDVVSSSSGISLESDYGNIENFSMTNTSLANASNYCLELTVEYQISNAAISNSTITSTDGYGIYLSTNDGDITDVSFTDCKLNTLYDGFYIYADMAAKDITIENDSIWNNLGNICCSYSNPLTVEGYHGGMDNIILNNNYIESGVDYSDNAIYLYSGDAQINNVSASNNKIISGQYGIYFDGYGGMNWTLDNNEINVEYDGIYGDSDGPIINASVSNNELIVGSGDGIYLYTEANITDLEVMDNTIEANYDGIYVEGYGGGILNCLISNNDVISSDGISLETNANIYNVDIVDNNIEASNYGLYVEADDYSTPQI